MIVLSLPYPISANRYWRTYMPRGFAAPVTTISKEAKAYRAEVALSARLAGVRSPIVGRVSVGILLYPKRPQDWIKRVRLDPDGWDDTVMCLDLDNANKVLFDSLKGVVIEDDKWVRRITSQRMEPVGEACVVVTIERIHVEQTQPSLAAIILASLSTSHPKSVVIKTPSPDPPAPPAHQSAKAMRR